MHVVNNSWSTCGEDEEVSKNSYQELLILLGDDEAQASRQYLIVRAKLITYFEGRKISPAEDHADEVLHRVAAKIAAGEKIQDINRYIFGIARFVRLEHYRRPEMSVIDEAHSVTERGTAMRIHSGLTVEPKIQFGDEHGSEGVMASCLSGCLAQLAKDKRQLLLAYYEADEASGKHIEQRTRLAERCNKSIGALQKQICLLRQTVSECTKDCVKRELG